MLENTQNCDNKNLDLYPLEQLKPILCTCEKQALPLKRKILLLCIGWVGFSVLGIIITYLALFISGQTILDSSISSIVNLTCYLIISIALIIVISPYFIKNMSIQFLNLKPYIMGIVIGALVLALSSGYSGILSQFNFGVNNNETSVRSIITVSPLVSFFIVVLLGPLCEELTYRVGLFNIGNKANKFVAYLCGTVIFALIHFDPFSKDIVTELLNLPDYLIAGFLFSYAYDKYGLPACLCAHMMNNLFAFFGNL